MLSILSDQQRKSKTPLERASQAFDLAATIGSLANTANDMYQKFAVARNGMSKGSPLGDYNTKVPRVMPKQYDPFNTENA